MPAATRATGNAIVSYLTTLMYSGGGSVYALAQLEQIKDVTDFIANGRACAEVYCNLDDNITAAFGGGKWDDQTWYILSMTSLDTPATAASIYDVRDALVTAIDSHTTLGGTIPGLFFAQWKSTQPGKSSTQSSGRFLRIERNGQEVQAHIMELHTIVSWTATLLP